MAMFDWTTAAAADRKRLAAEGSRLMVGHFENKELPHRKLTT
jgi:hypothetical protein